MKISAFGANSHLNSSVSGCNGVLQARQTQPCTLATHVALDREMGFISAAVVGVVRLDLTRYSDRSARARSRPAGRSRGATLLGGIGIEPRRSWALPVAGSIGWSSHTRVAHSLLPPHVEMRTVVPPSSESQFPSGFAASAALVRKQNAIAVVFNALILNSGVARYFVGQVLCDR